MNHLDKLQEQIAVWPGVTVKPHRFGGKEFCCGRAEIGHIHPGGILDVPMPRPIHDALLDEGLAEEHHWVRDSGWITYRVGGAQEVAHALWLLRLSYLRYALKKTADPHALFERERQSLQLNHRLTALLARFVPAGQPVDRR